MAPAQIEVRTYPLRPTSLIPNSPHVLIHYPGLLLSPKGTPLSPTQTFDLFTSNNWVPQWLARYSATQVAHYHSTAHECMAVVSGGSAKILFGVADAEFDAKHPDTQNPKEERKGVLLTAHPGDVFILPAGVAHKTHDPVPETEGMVFLEPPHKNNESECRAFFQKISLEGEFMMMGAYVKGAEWDFKTGGEDRGCFERVWSVGVPETDPVLGDSEMGIRGLWKGEGAKF